MTKNIKQNDRNLLISKLTESGISLESITNAAYAAELLIKKSPLRKSDALNPNHFNDYQTFFIYIQILLFEAYLVSLQLMFKLLQNFFSFCFYLY